jgi:hypothetical protein
MRKKLLVLIVLISTFTAFGQGCSDAGFCTLENFQVQSNDSLDYKNSFKVGVNLGSADNDVSVFGSYLEYNRKLSKIVDIDVKLNYLSQSISGFSSSALSDAYLVSNFKINPKTRASLGFKIPFTNGNLKDNGIALPMDFQPSLGTFDLILGLSQAYNNLSFALAVQQPLTQNENQFLAPLGSGYFSTNNYKRAGDVLFRATYLYKINDKWSLSPSLLPIYHLANDKFTDAANIEREINGSSGLTLNGNAYLNYQVNTRNSIELSLGIPLVVRDARPDGLTRGFVANLEYKIKF